MTAGSPIATDLFDRVGGDPADLTGPLVTEAARDGDPPAVELLAEIGQLARRRHRQPRRGLRPRHLRHRRRASARPATCCSRPARETFRRHLTGRGYRPEAEIVAARLGNEAGLVGAADLARVGAGADPDVRPDTGCEG